MKKNRNILRSQRGQGLIELGLSLPILFILSLGAVEISYMIDTWLVLSHLTREGANMISLGTPANLPGPNNDALDAIIRSSCPYISDGSDCASVDPARWTIIYSHIGSDPTSAGAYVVLAQAVRGGGGEIVDERRACPGCDLSDFTDCGSSCTSPGNVPNLGEIAAGGTFNVIEVFYAYQPVTNTSSFGIGLGSRIFYERGIF